MMLGFERSRVGLALALLLGCAIPFSSADAAAVPSLIETGTRLGDVRLFESEETPKELVFLFSDREGWNDRMGAAATDMAARDVAVVGVDLKRYLQALADSGDQDCHYLDSDIEQLSKQLQSKLGIAQYRWPIMAGIGAGGVLAYGAAAQAPDATIAGALVLDPQPSLDTRLPLCAGAPASRLAPGSFGYGPMPDMPGWLRVADRHAALQHAMGRADHGCRAGHGAGRERCRRRPRGDASADDRLRHADRPGARRSASG